MDRGAHFYKCDFQVHTPRDLNWKGDGATTAEERVAYGREFVSACRSKGLGAVAITDHHDIALFPFIRRAAAEETDDQGQTLPASRQLVVFPGMELTLAVPCQALLLLDADFPEGLLPSLVTTLAINGATGHETAKHGPTERLEHIKSLEDLHKRLDEQAQFKGRYIVLPNVGENGQFSLLRKAFAPLYKSMPCVGGYVDGLITQHGRGNADIVAGRNKDWGNKALGIFQTSDNRERAFTKLGTAHTWVKWARPTAEALRQACLARRSRISQEEPKLPPVRITRLEVSNSKFLGRFDVELNPQYTALIGGRGTGKSSILEYLRWALCDQPPALSDSEEERPDFQQRRLGLIDKTLKPFDASVQVHALINGTEHVVRRYVNDGRVMLKIGADELRPATEVEIRTLLPIQAYSQKQLSSVGVKGEELQRFVTLPIQGKLDGLRSRVAEAASKMKATHDALREQRRLRQELGAARTELGSIDQRLLALRQSLAGVSAEDRAVIDAQPGWAEERRVLGQWKKEAAQILSDLHDIGVRLSKLPSTPGTGTVNDPIRVNAIRELLRTAYRSAVEHVTAAEGALSGSEESKKAFSAWDEAATENSKKYAEAKGRAAESETTLKQITELEARHRELEEVVAEHDRRLAELADPELRFEQLKEDWERLHEERTTLLVDQCQQLSRQSKDWLKATVRKGAVTAPLAAQLRDFVKGTKMRTDKFDTLLQGVSSADAPVAAWLEVVSELRSLSEVEQPSTSPMPPCPRLGSAQIGEPDRRKLAEHLQEKGWAEFAVAVLEDEPHFEYRAREGEYIEFSDASAGQQATALMHVLLDQDGPPLVIDQPEDDLDNHVIKDIVEEVWLAKSRRQLIFSSHNANLVVNGDAELVVCCDYRVAGDQSGGAIKVQGAIDIEDVRTEIATVMEGGREAFSLRREKYGF